MTDAGREATSRGRKRRGGKEGGGEGRGGGGGAWEKKGGKIGGCVYSYVSIDLAPTINLGLQ